MPCPTSTSSGAWSRSMALFGIPGLSFSWRRALGISAFKGRVSRAIGIPLTRSGRQRKAGRLLGGVLGTVLLGVDAGLATPRATPSPRKRQPRESLVPRAPRTSRDPGTRSPRDVRDPLAVVATPSPRDCSLGCGLYLGRSCPVCGTRPSTRLRRPR